jgi:FkbM family methyltransferase
MKFRDSIFLVFLNLYRALFAKQLFFKLNKFLYRVSLSGMGVLNYETDAVSGESRFLKKLLKGRSGCVVFDVGANVGDYSRKVFQANPQVVVYAFEPHPTTYSVLANNIRRPNFYPVNAAAGEKQGAASLFDYEARDGSSHASLYKDVIENIHKAKSIEYKVKVIDLDTFAVGKNIDKIDLLKIDTEGNELSVLKGILHYINSGKIGAIHFEFNEMNVSSRTYFRDFWELLPNYDFYRLLPDGMAKIESYNPVYCEIFAYQNIVAIMKRN